MRHGDGFTFKRVFIIECNVYSQYIVVVIKCCVYCRHMASTCLWWTSRVMFMINIMRGLESVSSVPDIIPEAY